MGTKFINYSIWRKIISLIESGAHLTPEGLDEIIFLVKQLNV